MGNVFRDFPALVERLGIQPRGVVHVGAHEGQEMPFYAEAGIPENRVTLIEPHPRLAAALADRFPEATVVECACGAEPGEAWLSVMARTNLSTIAAPHPRDRVTRTIVVRVRALADIQASLDPRPNLLVVDAQGLELEVLRGADLTGVDLAIVETCTVPDPTMAALYEDVVEYMAPLGFVEVDRWVRDQDWVTTWARGRGQPKRRGEIRDLIFIRTDEERTP